MSREVLIQDSNFPGGRVVFLTARQANTNLVLPERIKSSHQNRISQWVTSRSALQLAFLAEGVDFQPENENPDSYTYMNHVFSLSHTADAAVAWVAPKSLGYSIGIDLEPDVRSISPAADKRVRREDDIALSPLELWSAKEAAFKCLPRDLQTDLLVPSIAIRSMAGFVAKLGLEGHWLGLKHENHLISLAWIRV